MQKRTLCLESPAHLGLQGRVMVVERRPAETSAPLETPSNLPEEREAASLQKEKLEKLYARYFPARLKTAPVPIPLEDISVIVADHPAITYTQQLLSALGSHNVILVVCDHTHMPNAMLMPLAGHHEYARAFRAQLELSVPAQKNIWKAIVTAKVREQAACLRLTDSDPRTAEKLENLAGRVTSGDKDKVEALAARLYFKALFGDGFERLKYKDRHILQEKTLHNAINSCLNYGYCLMRSLVARALVGAGLHPVLGIIHTSYRNPFALADDVMEPLRPLVDKCVYELAQRQDISLAQAKEPLINLLHTQISYKDSAFPLIYVVQKLAEEIRDALCSQKEGEDRKKSLKISIPQFLKS